MKINFGTVKRLASLLLIIAAVISFTSCVDLNLNVFSDGEKTTDWEMVTVLESESGSPYKYYYLNTLSKKEQCAYNKILEAFDLIENKIMFPESIDVMNLTQTELNNVYRALTYDNPRLYFLDGGKVKNGKEAFFAQYGMEFREYIKTVNQLNKVLASIKTKLDRLTMQAQKEEYIHDYIVNNCTYKSNSNGGDENSAYSALVNGTASCEGYAKAAKLLFDLAGIENYVISGETVNSKNKTEQHMWNIVKISGSYYHLDITWDDPVCGDGSNMLRHTYYNLSDSEISKTHSEFTKVNRCISTAQEYFAKNSLLFGACGEKEKLAIANAIADNWNSGREVTEIKFRSEAAFKSAINELFEQEEIYRLLDIAVLSAKGGIKTNEASYETNDTFYIIGITVIAK